MREKMREDEKVDASLAYDECYEACGASNGRFSASQLEGEERRSQRPIHLLLLRRPRRPCATKLELFFRELLSLFLSFSLSLHHSISSLFQDFGVEKREAQ